MPLNGKPRWSLISPKYEPLFFRVLFGICNGVEAIDRWRFERIWALKQSWWDHRCACFGHQRRTTSCYCSVCRRFQTHWLIADGAKALQVAIDQRVYNELAYVWRGLDRGV